MSRTSKKPFDFLKYGGVAAIVSSLAIAVGIGSLVVKGGPNWGIDFAGGTLIQIRFERTPDIDKVRAALKAAGHGGASIQHFGEDSEVLIRTAAVSSTDAASTEKSRVQEDVEAALEGAFADNPFEVRRVEMVGPKVGADLRRSAILAVVAATLGLLLYVSLRFRFSMALSAIVALVHDTLVTLGIFSLMDLEVNLPIVAALLTVIGYSLNDTIVIFDRVRENLRPLRRASQQELLNTSIVETLSRTLLTSLTTLVVVLALFFLGGPVIHGFSFALIIGVVSGTYSTIFIACPFLLLWERRFGQGLTKGGRGKRVKKSRGSRDRAGR